MAKPERPIHVLWIDDKHEELSDIRAMLSKERILVKGAFKSSEGGVAEFRRNPHNYEFIILDARALRRKGDAEDTVTEKSLRDSINAIRQMRIEMKRSIPFCVLTAFRHEIGDLWEDDVEIFQKVSKDISRMAQYIKQKVAALPQSQIRQEHPEVFDLFDNEVFDMKYCDHVIDLLIRIDTKDSREIEDLLGTCRRVLEGVYKKLSTDGYLHPDLFHAHGGPNLAWCERYLLGWDIEYFADPIPDPVIPLHLGRSLMIVRQNGSEWSHDADNAPHNYTLRTTVYALMDVLVWLGEFDTLSR